MQRPTYSAPRGGGYGGGGYGRGGYGGGGIGFPLLFPLFVGGGGSVFTLLILLGVGSFVIRALRSASEEGEMSFGSASPNVEVAEVQVGLLSSARNLQNEIDALALRSDPANPLGLSKLLQEVTLMLVRHDDYWAYGQTSQKTMALPKAEQLFNQLSLQERSKFSVESLSNVDSAISQLTPAQQAALAKRKEAVLATGERLPEVGEYIVVTLLVAARGSLDKLPVINSAESLRRCLMQLGAISAERLVAMEVLWTPQATDDTLTATELLTEYPQLEPI
jgi:uncharacterized membrane protein